MSTIRIDELIKILIESGHDINNDFSISFVDFKEHKEKYEGTIDFNISDGRVLNIDLDENGSILSIEFLKFT